MDMDRTHDSVGNGYRLCILRDLNGWIGNRRKGGVIGAFRVPGENDNGRRVMELYEERELCVGNTYFKHRSVHKYTRVARRRHGGEIKSIIDLLLGKKEMLRYVQDVRELRGIG